MLTYLDRVALAVASGSIVAALNLQSIADLKWAFAAFAFAYAIFEIPTGWLGDIAGPKRTLVRIVLCWSACTVLVGLTGFSVLGVFLGLMFLVVVNFLFGVGEAGAYPNLNRALYNWFPVQERGFAQGLLWMCAKLMGGLTPLIWVVLVQGSSFPPLLPSWRWAFYLFGGLGFVWCLLFWKYFRNLPEEAPAVNAEELTLIQAGRSTTGTAHGGVPWRKIFASRTMWFLCLMYGCQAYGWYFNITYLPRFLEQQYAVPAASFVGALYKGGPLWLGAMGCLLGGFLTDRLVRRLRSRRWGRRVCGFVGHSGCVICFLLAPHMPTALTFFLVISLAAFMTDLTVSSAWTICQDIGGSFTAVVSAIMNTTAGLFGALAGIVTGFVLEHALARHAAHLGVAVMGLNPTQQADGLMKGYHVVFLIFAFAYAVALICWFFIDAGKPLFAEGLKERS